jgi:hypothetical protein
MQSASRKAHVGEVSSYAEILSQFGRLRDQFSNSLQWSVTESFDQSPVCFRDAGELRRKYDQFTAFLNDWTKSIAGLAANPKILIMRVKESDDSLVLSSRVFDVDATADLCSFPHCPPDISAE